MWGREREEGKRARENIIAGTEVIVQGSPGVTGAPANMSGLRNTVAAAECGGS